MKAREPRILLIDPDPILGAALRADPALAGCTFDDALGEAQALRRLRRHAYDLVITSPISSVGEDLALLEELRGVRPGVKTIVLARSATPDRQATRRTSWRCSRGRSSSTRTSSWPRSAVAAGSPTRWPRSSTSREAVN